ncbi:MAG: hypothetical protein AAGH90_02095 [Pseudomonadota bacterium]
MTKNFAKMTVLAAALTLSSAVADELGSTVKQADTNPKEAPLNEWFLIGALGQFDGFDAGNAADVNYGRLRVEARLNNNVNVFFNCITLEGEEGEETESVFDAAINLDTTKEDFKKNLRWQIISARLTVGERKKNYRWKWNPVNMVMAPVQKQAARRLFNGVVKGEAVSVKVFGDTYINSTLPEMNDAFKTFYRNCPALSGS